MLLSRKCFWQLFMYSEFKLNIVVHYCEIHIAKNVKIIIIIYHDFAPMYISHTHSYHLTWFISELPSSQNTRLTSLPITMRLMPKHMQKSVPKFLSLTPHINIRRPLHIRLIENDQIQHISNNPKSTNTRPNYPISQIL